MTKILFLTPELPYPPTSGGKLKSWEYLKFLNQHYQVSVGSILKGDDVKHLDEFHNQIKLDNFYCEPVNQVRNLSNLIKSYIKGIPLNVFRTFSKAFAHQTTQIIEQYDLVISDHYEVFQYIPHNYSGKVILHEHNAYYLMWERYAQSPKNGLLNRLACLFESQRVKKYEKAACNRSHLIFAAPNDIDSLEQIGVDKNKLRYTYHLGDDGQLHLPELKFEETNCSLLYVGSLNWEANIDGLLWFISFVWPGLKQRWPELKLTIVGNNPNQRLIEAAKSYPDIHFPGFVANLEPYFKSHRVFIAPLLYGAGMKVKVLNAMCRGIPTVTTVIGSEGLEFKNMTHLAIAETPDEMTQNINRLLQDKIFWHKLCKSSRTLIMEQYTWKRLFIHMDAEMQRLINPPHNNRKKDIHQSTHLNLA